MHPQYAENINLHPICSSNDEEFYQCDPVYPNLSMVNWGALMFSYIDG